MKADKLNSQLESSTTFSDDSMQELVALATKHHAQDILDDLPARIEPEFFGALYYLRRIDHECSSEAC